MPISDPPTQNVPLAPASIDSSSDVDDPLSTLTPPPPTPPALCHSTHVPAPLSHTATHDGLAPSLRLSAIMANITATALRRQEEHAARRATQQDDHTDAFLSEFAPFCNTHHLVPTDLNLDDHAPFFPSVDEVLSAMADSTLEPTLDTSDDPSWPEALVLPEREYWIAGVHDELKSLEDLKVFVLVPRSEVPRGQRPLKGKLVCKRKRDDKGNVVRYKVRYVAKGYAQRYGIDYDKTTTPTVRLESLRAISHIAATLGWDIQHFDIKTTFLHGILPDDETMFMEQPPGFKVEGKEDWVLRLLKSIFGMKQASRVWNKTFDKVMKELGFERLDCKWCVYRRQTPSGIIIFLLHVNDILSTASTQEENERFKVQLRKH